MQSSAPGRQSTLESLESGNGVGRERGCASIGIAEAILASLFSLSLSPSQGNSPTDVVIVVD